MLPRYKPYFFLIPLIALALFYQVTYSVMVARIADPSHNKDVSIFTSNRKIADLNDRAQKAGLRKGDTLLGLDGHAIRGDRDFWRALHTDGSRIPLAVEALPQHSKRSRVFYIAANAAKNSQSNLMDKIVSGLLVLVMLFCVLVGAYPALIMPRDAKALIFLGLMVGTAQILKSAQWFDFPQPLQLFALLFYIGALMSWPVWLILFGLYFPNRFEWERQRPWLKWLLVSPFVILSTVAVVLVATAYFDYNSAEAITNALHINSLSSGWALPIAFAALFTSIITKLKISHSHDERRRLKILLAGCAVGLLPLGGLVLYQALGDWSALHPVPEVLVIPICFLFCLFPITLAYVIVAERAMALRMVIRQGIRYTLAKAGLRILAALILAAVLFGVSEFVFRPGWVWFGSKIDDRIKTTIYLAIVVIGVIGMRRMRGRLMAAVDKRFFREAYDSELILEELSDSVRSINDEELMLETVARRISESLHVSHFAILLEDNERYRPVYCLGFHPTHELTLPQDSKALEIVRSTPTPAPIYFDRTDNWIHSTPHAELVTLRSLHTQLLLPLGRKDKLLGMIALGQKRSEEPYSRSDLQLLKSVATQTSFALENSRLTKAMAVEMAQREKLNREIEIAREVQQRLFPQRLHEVPGVDYCGACRPALGVGGDYYDFLVLANGDLGVAIGDVSGKGIAAALLMASLQASLRGQALVGQGDLAQLMKNINQLVYDATPINRYATFFYGQYNHSDGLFRYVNAGHNPPVVLRKAPDGSTHVIRLETGGPVVGLFPGVPYQEGSLQLEPGDIFIGFTDGISEAMNNEEEEWGEERLIPAAAACRELSASDIIPSLMQEADQFVSGAPQHDDMTLIVLKTA